MLGKLALLGIAGLALKSKKNPDKGIKDFDDTEYTGKLRKVESMGKVFLFIE